MPNTTDQIGRLTVWGGTGLALEAEGGSEAGAVVEAPALLHLGGGSALRTLLRHRGTPVVDRRRLATFDALPSRARHPHAVFEAQLLATVVEKGGGGNGTERAGEM